MNTEKTPYQLRLEILQEARQILTETYLSQNEQARELFQYYKEHNNKEEMLDVQFPNPPTVMDILKTASIMRQFIDLNKKIS
jgi:hypothetical protein